MKKLTMNEIQNAVGGRLIGGSPAILVERVSIDSRETQKGDLFFAIIGDNNDGHKFIPQVIERGCKNLVISDPKAVDSFTGQEDINWILVEDTLKALQALAVYYLNQLDLKKIAVTGSVGKTSTRDMIYAVCSEKFRCGKNSRNFNNHIGVPLTILSFAEDIQVAVIEMGMDKFGEIDTLADMVRPDIGVITNIGMAHIENLGSREGIFQAKMELVNYFEESDTLIVNQDEEFLNKERIGGNYRLVTIGENGKSDYIISAVDDFGAEGIQFTLEYKDQAHRFKLPVAGRHNAVNAALAVAAGMQLGVTMEEAKKGLAGVALTDNRLEVKGKNGIKVIDDTYNASPDSMRGAINCLKHTRGLRRVAILGDMFELGEDSQLQHELIGRYAARQGIDLVIAIGDNAEFLAKGAENLLPQEQVRYFNRKEAFLKEIPTIIEPGDVILVKGSRGMKMEQIVKKIME